MSRKLKQPRKRQRRSRCVQRVVRTPRRDRVGELANALASICNQLVSVGLGPINLGKIARHMLKLRRPNGPDQR